MLQRTVFMNKIRMLQRTHRLQRTRKNTIGRRSKHVRMTFSIIVYSRERVTIRITNRCDFFCTMSLFPFSRLFPTCFGPSWAHHQGYFKLLFLCYHLVRVVLCWSSACVSGLVCGGDFGVKQNLKFIGKECLCSSCALDCSCFLLGNVCS